MGDEELLKRVNEVLCYDPETGFFSWKINRRGGSRAGYIAGSRHREGYIEIMIDGKSYLAHRLVFLVVHGYFPAQVDHIGWARMPKRCVEPRC